jgi:RimJ/RimL family protein N-acetyltransferase
MKTLAPITLHNDHATLAPLEAEHVDALSAAAADGQLWKLWYTFIPEPAGMMAEIERRLERQARGEWLPFTVFDNAGSVVGMTNFMNIDQVNRRLEIGGTWYAASVQRTPLNTACKLLLLKHAFDDLDCIAVEFRTHIVNQPSRRAIERLGAKLDGILRNHMIMPNGTYRDTCVYSIIQGEWSTIEALLQYKLQ